MVGLKRVIKIVTVCSMEVILFTLLFLTFQAKWCFKDLTFNKILMAALEGQV